MVEGVIERKKGSNLFLILGYIVLGIYFVNYPLNFVTIPEYVSRFDSWIIFVGGILMFFGAINYFKVKRRNI